MSITDELVKIAQEYASNLELRVPAIQQELADIEAQYRKKQAELDTARSAFKRTMEFSALLRREGELCPYCWIDNGVKARLRGIGPPPGNTDRFLDFYVCNSCERTFST